MARQKKSELEGFEDIETMETEATEPDVVKKQVPTTIPTLSTVKPIKAPPELAHEQFHLHVGYVNKYGVLFPMGFRFKGGHVSFRDVVLNRCYKCGHRQSIDEACMGECQNMKVPPLGEPCGHSAYDELNSYELG